MSQEFLDIVDKDTRRIFSAEFSELIKIIFVSGIGEETEITTTGIFDKTYAEVDPDTGAMVSSNNSRASVHEKEIIDAIGKEINSDEDDDWRCVIRGITYHIREVERDGVGIANIILKEK